MLPEMASFHSFLWPSSIPSYVPDPFHCSSVGGHLGCFHVLAVVNSAATDIKVHLSFWITVLSGYIPRGGITGSDGNLPILLIFQLCYILLLSVFNLLCIYMYICVHTHTHTHTRIFCLFVKMKNPWQPSLCLHSRRLIKTCYWWGKWMIPK